MSRSRSNCGTSRVSTARSAVGVLSICVLACVQPQPVAEDLVRLIDRVEAARWINLIAGSSPRSGADHRAVGPVRLGAVSRRSIALDADVGTGFSLWLGEGARFVASVGTASELPVTFRVRAEGSFGEAMRETTLVAADGWGSLRLVLPAGGSVDLWLEVENGPGSWGDPTVFTTASIVGDGSLSLARARLTDRAGPRRIVVLALEGSLSAGQQSLLTSRPGARFAKVIGVSPLAEPAFLGSLSGLRPARQHLLFEAPEASVTLGRVARMAGYTTLFIDLDSDRMDLGESLGFDTVVVPPSTSEVSSAADVSLLLRDHGDGLAQRPVLAVVRVAGDRGDEPFLADLVELVARDFPEETLIAGVAGLPRGDPAAASLRGAGLDRMFWFEWPGVVPTLAVPEHVSGQDFAPTLADLAGLGLVGSEGQSLVPLIAAPGAPTTLGYERRPAFAELPSSNGTYEADSPAAIIAEGWKLIWRPDDVPAYLLYDVVGSSSDRRDVAGRHPELVKRLARLLSRWRGDAVLSRSIRRPAATVPGASAEPVD